MSPSPLPRDLSEHIPLIVTTNIRITTLLCRCNNKYLDIIWKLHCYNLSVLLQQLCVEIILLQLLNVVTVFITTYSLNVVTMEYFIVTITITSFTHALQQFVPAIVCPGMEVNIEGGARPGMVTKDGLMICGTDGVFKFIITEPRFKHQHQYQH